MGLKHLIIIEEWMKDHPTVPFTQGKLMNIAGINRRTSEEIINYLLNKKLIRPHHQDRYLYYINNQEAGVGTDDL